MNCKSKHERDKLIKYLGLNNVHATFHYLPLHKSKYYESNYGSIQSLQFAEFHSDRIIRLPIYFDLTKNDIRRICRLVVNFLINSLKMCLHLIMYGLKRLFFVALMN